MKDWDWGNQRRLHVRFLEVGEKKTKTQTKIPVIRKENGNLEDYKH